MNEKECKLSKEIEDDERDYVLELKRTEDREGGKCFFSFCSPMS